MQIKSNLQTILPRMAFAIVGFAFILSLSCPVTETVEATDPIANSANSGVAVKAKPALSVGLSSAFNMEIQPSTTGGTFAKQTATLSIATNNVTGYKAYLYTSNGKSTLDPKNSNNTSTINAVTSASTESNFPMNSWGYSLSKDAVSESTTYSAMPTTNSDDAKVIETESATASDSYNFTIGTLVNLSLPNDTYKNEAVISIVANPVILPISSLETMQEVEAANCEKSVEGETIQLTDTRDGKKYWVAKLADGNCWMTQNLDLDLNADTLPLKPATSDVAADWNPGSTYYTSTSITSQSDNANAYYSWDVGKVVYNQPNRYNSDSKYCSTSSSSASAFLTNCASYVTDVSNMTDDYKATQSSDTDYTWSAVSGNSYDAHYTIGNYYQWYAATAGSGSTLTTSGNKAEQSICPKGWKLPLSYSSNDSGDSLYNLLSKYTSPSGSGNLTSGSAVNVAALAAPGLYDASPYLFRAGYVNSGAVRGVGYRGYYWSSMASGSTYAYVLSFSGSGIYPSSSIDRYSGDSVRCVL